MTQITTSFWWVRHAPVAHGGRIYGQTDLSCDCSETALFTGLAEKLPHNAIWVTSNLRRTQETAAAIVCAGLPGPRRIPGPDAVILSELAEQDFGEWQGLTYEELEESPCRRFPSLLARPRPRDPTARREFRRRHRTGIPGNSPAGRDTSRTRHHRRRAWRDDPRRAGIGARPPPRSRARLHDRELLDHPHRPHRRSRYGSRLARFQSEPTAAVKRGANQQLWKKVDPEIGELHAPSPIEICACGRAAGARAGRNGSWEV